MNPIWCWRLGFTAPPPPSFNFYLRDTTDNSNPFWIDTVIPVDSTRYFRLYFQPFGEISYNGDVLLHSNAGVDTLHCTGSGSTSISHFDTDTLDYGVVSLGQTDTAYVKIWNTGALPLILTNFKLDSTRIWSDTLNFGYLSSPNQDTITTDTLNLPVVFHPTVAGPHEAILRIYTSIPNSPPWSVRLIGTGTSQLVYWIGNVGDTTWSTASADSYYVVGDVTVPAGQTLTIEPGVNVRFEGNFKITVNGTLTANGTPTNPITFTTIIADSVWHGLRFKSGSSGSVLQNCILYRSADSLNSFGGAVSVEDASPTFQSCTFYDNSTYKFNGTINYNFGSGGAVAVKGNSAPLFKQCTFYNNQSLNGGAFYADWLSKPILDSCQVFNNMVGDSVRLGNGGGINLSGSIGTVRYCEIANNTATGKGGGVYLGSGATTEMHHNRIYADSAAYGGGVAIVFYTRPYLHDESIFENKAALYGAGLYIEEGSSPIVRKTLIADNNGVAKGRALYSVGSSPLVNFCTMVAQPGSVSGWLVASSGGDASMITNSILGSSDWSISDSAAVSNAGSNLAITYSDVVGLSGTLYPGTANANLNPQFVLTQPIPQKYWLQTGSPADTLSDQHGTIGFTGISPALTNNLTLTMLQNPASLYSLNFVLSSTIPLMAPPYLVLEQDLPDTVGYITIDSTFMNLTGPGVYVQPLLVTSISAPSRLKITFTNIFGTDTLLQQSFIASNLTGTYSTLSYGDVILQGRSASGQGIWGLMPELYGSAKPLGSQMQSVGMNYQVLLSGADLNEGRLEFVLDQNLLAGRSAAHCSIARWAGDGWQVLPSLLSSDLTTISTNLTTEGVYKVIWGETLECSNSTGNDGTGSELSQSL